jgi:hypothetical protein
MARPDFVNQLLDQLAAVLVERVTAHLSGKAAATGTRRRGPSHLRGKHFSAAKMRCRFLGWKNRSKGPKFSFLCEEHRKLGKRAVKAAIAKAAEA